MKPPSSDGYDKLVFEIIADRPGITFNDLTITTSLWSDELARITLGLKQSGIIEFVDGGFVIRTRKKKLKPKKRLRDWLREQLA